MHRDLVCIALLMLFINIRYVKPDVCPSIDVRNDVTELERLRNCTIIMGDLKLVLMDQVENGSDFTGYSFPELTEIVDYLMVYSVPGLLSLGQLFPNLKVIRGRKLFREYSLVIFSVPHLREIGLTSLEHIFRGSIKVDYCSELCYVRTVDWQSLGAHMLDFPPTQAQPCSDQDCPNECAGYCWNKKNCQKRTYDYCKYFIDDGNCVQTCPKSKVINYDNMRCMTKEECGTIVKGTYWVFNDTCINSCPLFYIRDETVEGGCRYVAGAYRKECTGDIVVEAFYDLEALKDCTHINGYLEIRVSNSQLEPYLEKYLGNIKSISGYLKIGRSKAITSLEFLKNLTLIEGEKLENGKYSLFVYENKNLRRLWNFSDNFNLTILTGTVAFHDNPELCLPEIEKLEKTQGISSKVDKQVSLASNGYKSNCNQRDMQSKLTENNPTNVTIEWVRTPAAPDEAIIGYTVYYIKDTGKPITSYEAKGACDAYSWEGIFVRVQKVQLRQLTPSTRYFYYIKTYTTVHPAEQTPLYNFCTASTQPSEPLEVRAKATSDMSILLEWSPPENRNGELIHYDATQSEEEDYLPTVQQRNYCDYPHSRGYGENYFPKHQRDYCMHSDFVELPEESQDVTTVLTNITKSDNCSCGEKPVLDFFDDDSTCKASDTTFDGYVKCVCYAGEKPETTTKKEISNNSDSKVKYIIIPANKTSFEFKHLKHYTLYAFHIRACNVDSEGVVLCGPATMASQRTQRGSHADAITKVHIKIDRKDAKIKWTQPQQVNSVLVSYHIQYKRTDSEHSKPRCECITEEDYQRSGRLYKIVKLSPGSYAIRVKAVSLAGPGSFSEWEYFDINSDDASVFVILGPIFAVIFVALFTAMGVYWFRRKRKLETNYLITSINPDYAGPIYVEDEWEIDRNDIEIIKELGHGSFGMVYEGIIKSRRYPCAIKTINETTSMPNHMEFLNEGSVMKTFSDAHHVVRLVGIVSRGQPPLVIMELMERGDLKSYLRRCREPSQNLTTNELYRMAVEIADGMAYLAAKKFVHRDLAARNCMVAADRTVKIGDFGMARDIYETDYYRKETAGFLPVRWMAPESLADGVFTSDSDVWSYGIVLWEMATLAEQPYQGLSNEEVFHFVKNKGKLERPSECSDLLYEVMDACWMWRPNDRPTFSHIVNKLADHVGEDFRIVAFCFSRQGLELALNAGPRVYNPPAMVTVPEEDYFGHYDPSEEEVNLYVGESNRPTNYYPYSSQRMNMSSPYQMNPGSPSSTLSFNSP